MYIHHYQLKEKPFQNNTDRRFLWLGRSFSTIASSLENAILMDRGLVLLLGDAGSGKTMLVNWISDLLKDRSVIAPIHDPDIECLEFFNILAERFQIRKQFTSKSVFLIHLRNFLRNMHSMQKSVLLIFDDAHRINIELLKELSLLAEVEMNNQKMITALLTGQQTLLSILKSKELKDVGRKISGRYELGPLSKSETTNYINHRLKLSGSGTDIFDKGAINEIFSFSRGNPRKINTLCDQALMAGYMGKKQHLDAAIIKDCIGELSFKRSKNPNDIQLDDFTRTKSKKMPAQRPRENPFRRSYGFIAFLALLGFFSIFLIYLSNINNEPLWDIEEIAPQKYNFPALREKEILAPQFEEKREEASILNKAATQETSEKNGEATSMTASGEPAAGSDGTEETLATAALEPKPESKRPDVPSEAELFSNKKIIIHFQHNSNEISGDALKTLDNLASHMINYPGKKLVIRGYTDSRGALSYNMTISKYRADSVKSYLAARGVNPDNIQSLGMGPKDPLHSNKTQEGRKLNRRVEIEWVEGD